MSSPQERSLELQRLRRAHNHAIESFQYAEARQIQSQIDAITSRARVGSHRRATNRESEIEMQYETADEKYSSQVAGVLATFRTRFARLLAKHDREIRALSRERRDAIERERARPVTDVDHLLTQSKVFARDHQYENAQDVFERAMQRRDEIVGERVDACRATYRDQKRQLIEKQEQELAIMNEVIDARLGRMRQEHGFQIEVINYRHRINEFRAGVWPPENYSLGNFRTGRDPKRPGIRTARPHGY